MTSPLLQDIKRVGLSISLPFRRRLVFLTRNTRLSLIGKAGAQDVILPSLYLNGRDALRLTLFISGSRGEVLTVHSATYFMQLINYFK